MLDAVFSYFRPVEGKPNGSAIAESPILEGGGYGTRSNSNFVPMYFVFVCEVCICIESVYMHVCSVCIVCVLLMCK